MNKVMSFIKSTDLLLASRAISDDDDDAVPPE